MADNKGEASGQKPKVSDAPWDGSSANYRDAEHYCASCLIDLNKGGDKVASNCKLPYRTAEGAVSRAGAHNAASRLNQTQAPPNAKSEAARKLVNVYHHALGEPPPPSLVRAAKGTAAMNELLRRQGARGKSTTVLAKKKP